MASGHPPTRGTSPFVLNLNSFPPLPSKLPGNPSTSSQNPNQKNGVQEQPSTSQPSYAEFVRSRPFIPISNLPPLPDVAIKSPMVMEKEGIKAVIFQQEEVEASMQAYRYALVARFHGERPSVDTFERHVNSEWGLSKPAVVGLLNPRHIMIRMDSERDFTHAWVREENSFLNHRFTLYKWSEGIMNNKEMKRAVWIELQQLPVMYQMPSMLEQIANNIGRFLQLDARTQAGKHPIAPRICVELDCAAPLPTEVWIGFITPAGNHIGFTQKITYDFNRSRCSFCKMIGHEFILCPQRNTNAAIIFKKRPFQSSVKPNVVQGNKPAQKQIWVTKQGKENMHTKEKGNSPLPKEPGDKNAFPSQFDKVMSPRVPRIIEYALGKDNGNSHNSGPIATPITTCHVPLSTKTTFHDTSATSLNGHKEYLAPNLNPNDKATKFCISTALDVQTEQALVPYAPPNFEDDVASSQEITKLVTLNPGATPYLANRYAVLSEPFEHNQAIIPYVVEPLQVKPIEYGPLFHIKGAGGISWHEEKRNYSKDKITISSLFKIEENQVVMHAPPKLVVYKRRKTKTVSWIHGDIQSVHTEQDIEDNIEEIIPRGKPTIKTFKYSKAYRMEGAKHVAWASKYFRDRINYIDEMDQKQLEYWEKV